MSISVYIPYIPNLGLEIAVFDQGKEQGRFRGSSGGASREQVGSRGNQGGSKAERSKEGVVQGPQQ